MENKPISEILEGGELYHHGILGMKWGIRRFQPYSLIPRKSGKGGKETGAAKKAGGEASSAKKVPVKSVVKKSRKQKSAEAKAEVQKKANTARERRESLEQAIRNADVKTVYQRRAELTDKELENFVKRVQTDQSLRAMAAAQTPSKKQKLKDIVRKLDEYNDVVQTGLKIYKTGVEVKDVLDKQHKAMKQDERNAKISEIVNDTSRLAELYANRKDYSKESIDKAVNKYNSEQSLKKILDSQAESSKKGSDEKESKNAVDVDFDVSTSTKAADNKREDTGGAHGIKAQKWVKESSEPKASAPEQSEAAKKQVREVLKEIQDTYSTPKTQREIDFDRGPRPYKKIKNDFDAYFERSVSEQYKKDHGVAPFDSYKGMTVREIREDQEMRKKLGLPPREYKQRVNY